MLGVLMRTLAVLLALFVSSPMDSRVFHARADDYWAGTGMTFETAQALNAHLKTMDPYAELVPRARVQALLGDATDIQIRERDAILNIRVGRFARGTCRAIESHLGGKIVGVVLDLRGNPGGYLEEAECVARIFLGPREIVRKHPVPSRVAKSFGLPMLGPFAENSIVPRLLSDLPLVVVIDGHSKSASEVVAAAIQDYRRGTLIGQHSFGKDTSQILEPLPTNDQLILVRTVARLKRPLGGDRTHGIEPDIKITGPDLLTRARNIILRDGPRT